MGSLISGGTHECGRKTPSGRDRLRCWPLRTSFERKSTHFGKSWSRNVGRPRFPTTTCISPSSNRSTFDLNIDLLYPNYEKFAARKCIKIEWIRFWHRLLRWSSTTTECKARITRALRVLIFAQFSVWPCGNLHINLRWKNFRGFLWLYALINALKTAPSMLV